jgi:signal peptidase I
LEGLFIDKKLTMRKFIGHLLFAAILLLIATRFLSVTSETAFPISIVTADSMSPSLMEGDLILWTPVTIEDIEVGDVVVFKSWLSWPEERLVVHRVIEKKQTGRGSALVTKGDANEWTDQAGPHIPEPYITESNFIGKTLSIGSQPLKIPFVGRLGLWLNQALSVLSQPSAAKGTTTYVGVFMPLTIAVILLVVSIFILPEREKNKTIREKIHYYIMGSQLLNIKKAFAFFFFIFVLLLVLVHFFAYDSISASVGVGEFPDESEFKIGSIKPGQTTMPRTMPVSNPGVLPVKGVIVGEGEMEHFINRDSFIVNPVSFVEMNVTASISNDTVNGSYVGRIMVYSSPLWMIFPDNVIVSIANIHAQSSIIILDVLSAVVLTFLTILTMIAVSFIARRYRSYEINLSWHYAPRLYLKKGIMQHCKSFFKGSKNVLSHRFNWLGKIDLSEIDIKPLFLGSFVLIPLFLLVNSEILAMIIASIASGIIAYYLRCRLRKEIIIVSSTVMIMTVGFLSLKTNYDLFTSNKTIIESLALGLGSVGVYLLLLAFLLVPISLVSWYITNQIRNLKERKEPLLILEGRCDL